MKKINILILICAYLLLPYKALAANTYSADFELNNSEYLSITDASQTGLEPSSAITMEAWVKPESAVSGEMDIINKYNDSTNERQYRFRLLPGVVDTNKYVVHCIVSETGSGGYTNIRTSNEFAMTSWTHTACTWKATGNMYIYVDGVQEASGASGSASLANKTGVFSIGAVVKGTVYGYFDGLIDDVRLWSVQRTQSEIDTNKSVELTGSETGLQGYWKLNNDALDETSNNNDLTNNNTVTFSTDVAFGGAAPPAKKVIIPELLIFN